MLPKRLGVVISLGLLLALVLTFLTGFVAAALDLNRFAFHKYAAYLAVGLVALFARVQWKYVDRSYRYALLEAGHLGQNVYLAATALRLGPCGIGAYFDDDLNRLLDVDGYGEAVVYTMAVGVART
jgi:SagB-type dehydrogenase family enzyme